MANVISVTVYDFNTTGNKKFTTEVLGLPSLGAFVLPATSPDRNSVGGMQTYIYSKIVYPALGAAGKEYLTAESVESLITKANA